MPRGSTAGTYDVVSDVPFLLVTSPAIVIDDKQHLTPQFHVIVRDSAGSVIPCETERLSAPQWTHNMPDGVDHPHEYWFIFPDKDYQDLTQVHVRFEQYRVREFSFYIRPPSLDVYRELGCLPSTVRLAE